MTAHAASAAEMTAPAPRPARAAALDWIAPVRAWQTVAWEAASLAVAAGYGRAVPIETAAYVGAGALVGMSSLRVHGRCLAQWADTQARYRYRRLATRRRPEAGVEPLGALLPDLGLGQYVDRAGNRVGLASSQGGWVSAVRLGPSAEPDLRALIGVLREAFEDATIPLTCAQLVVWTAAGPGGAEAKAEAGTGTNAPLNGAEALNGAETPTGAEAPKGNEASNGNAASAGTEAPDLSTTVTLPAFTRDLTTTVTVPALTPDLSETVTLPAFRPDPPAPPTPPAPHGPMRVYWLALRYRPRQAPYAALARGGGEIGAARTAASAALGLVARLDAAGYPADALDQFELGQELLVALNAGDPTPTEVRQTWREWSTGRLRQVCYLPHRRLDPAELLDRWTPGAAFTCASYTLSRTPRGRIQDESVLRIAAADADVETLAPPMPAVRAGGRQQEFVLRTLPLAVCR